MINGIRINKICLSIDFEMVRLLLLFILFIWYQISRCPLIIRLFTLNGFAFSKNDCDHLRPKLKPRAACNRKRIFFFFFIIVWALNTLEPIFHHRLRRSVNRWNSAHICCCFMPLMECPKILSKLWSLEFNSKTKMRWKKRGKIHNNPYCHQYKRRINLILNIEFEYIPWLPTVCDANI